MPLVKRTSGLAWWALVACLSLWLVSIGVSSSHAQTGSPTKVSGTFEGEDGTDTGDPDMPTGDTPPASDQGSPGTDTGAYRVHATAGGVTEAVPSKRYGQWASWKIALKLFARNFLIR